MLFLGAIPTSMLHHSSHHLQAARVMCSGLHCVISSLPARVEHVRRVTMLPMLTLLGLLLSPWLRPWILYACPVLRVPARLRKGGGALGWGYTKPYTFDVAILTSVVIPPSIVTTASITIIAATARTTTPTALSNQHTTIDGDVAMRWSELVFLPSLPLILRNKIRVLMMTQSASSWGFSLRASAFRLPFTRWVVGHRHRSVPTMADAEAGRRGGKRQVGGSVSSTSVIALVSMVAVNDAVVAVAVRVVVIMMVMVSVTLTMVGFTDHEWHRRTASGPMCVGTLMTSVSVRIASLWPVRGVSAPPAMPSAGPFAAARAAGQRDRPVIHQSSTSWNIRTERLPPKSVVAEASA